MCQRTSQASPHWLRARRFPFRGLPVWGFTESELDSGRTSGNLAANMSARLLPSSLSRRYAWVPIPVLLTLIIGLWVVNLQGVYESRFWMLFFNIFFTFLAGLCICVLSARGFVQTGRPGLLMFSCGALLWGVTSLSAAAIVVNYLNASVTVHNVGILGAAVCHLAGLLWHGRLPRPGRWLVAGYAGTVVVVALIFWAAVAGLTPIFFVQGAGGTLIRHVVLWLAVAVFGLVAWQMWARSGQPANAFYYWYGLGLGLVATGLVGVALLTVQGGVLGWTNRLTQYLGSAYLFVAALAAMRETGSWTIDLATELAEARAAARASEIRLRRLSDAGLLGVIYWNTTGQITDANDKFLQMLGYTRADLTAGRIDWLHLTPPEYRHLDEQSLVELKTTGVNRQPFEKEYLRHDGTRLPILVAGAMLDDARTQGIAFVLDISDRKAADLELRARVAELRQMNDELSRFNRVAVDRELRMVELKKEINALCTTAGQPPRYPLPPA